MLRKLRWIIQHTNNEITPVFSNGRAHRVVIFAIIRLSCKTSRNAPTRPPFIPDYSRLFSTPRNSREHFDRVHRPLRTTLSDQPPPFPDLPQILQHLFRPARSGKNGLPAVFENTYFTFLFRITTTWCQLSAKVTMRGHHHHSVQVSLFIRQADASYSTCCIFSPMALSVLTRYCIASQIWDTYFDGKL